MEDRESHTESVSLRTSGQAFSVKHYTPDG